MAHTTEINVNGVITPVVEFDHSAQEIDNAVDQAKKAMPRDGSGMMTGNIIFEKSNPMMVMRNTTGDGAAIQTFSNKAAIFAFNDATATTTADYRRFDLCNNAAQADFSKALVLRDVTSGKATEFNILHTGNKPSGSYTGNGSATSRTINVGGIGNTLIIYTLNNIVLVSKYNAIGFNVNMQTMTYYTNSELHFDGGILTIASDKSYVNSNGATYYYRVL